MAGRFIVTVAGTLLVSEWYRDRCIEDEIKEISRLSLQSDAYSSLRRYVSSKRGISITDTGFRTTFDRSKDASEMMSVLHRADREKCSVSWRLKSDGKIEMKIDRENLV